MVATRASINRRHAGLMLLLLFCLGCVFLFLAYERLALFEETRRIRGNLSGLFGAVLNVGLLFLLALGAWAGPIAYLIRIIRRKPRDDRPD